jgi:Trk K+ transport system NAD-binding subunit
MTPRDASPFSISAYIGSPLRNLATIVSFLAAVIAVATGAYMAAGWSLGDAFYMVMLTVFTVGFREVRPIDGAYLRTVTLGVMFLGCTGMILMTGALVQLFTANEIRNLLGSTRMKTDINRLNDHIIVCGYGRIGATLARELADGGADFVVIDHNPERGEAIRAQGFLCLVGDATDEVCLSVAGIGRARALATVLPDDAANVFITLTARSLNKELAIIARGEVAQTERKLIAAGADKVILPTHIGAERIAELILHPQTAELVRGGGRTVERALRDFGLEIEVVSASQQNGIAGLTVAEVERRAAGAFLVAQVERPGQTPVRGPAPDTVIRPGDGLVVIGRHAGAVERVFAS